MPYNSNYVAISKKDSIAEDRWNNKEDKQKYRSPFAKDRDRILYSRSFLRMRGKTQVFMPQNLDYIRTRLTHTLEVNQIAKTVATALDINLDLVEAIAYGHDVGHTPFGHVGERALDNILNGCEAIGVEIEADNRGFKHNLQALRLLCDLEQGAAEMGCGGLNLTLFTLWGIAYHTSNEHKKCDMCGDICKSVHTHCKCDRVDNNRPSYSFYFNYMRRVEKYWSFEGLVVKQADEIAQRHHDIEDSIRMGILNKSALVDKMEAMLEGIKLSKEDRKNLKSLKQAISSQDDYFLAIFSRFLVNFYVVDLINHTKHQIKALEEKYRINNHADYINKRDIIKAEDYIM